MSKKRGKRQTRPSKKAKRSVRAFTRINEEVELREYQFVEDAADAAGFTFLGHLDALVDHAGLVVFCHVTGEPTPEQLAQVASVPEGHKEAALFCAIPMLETYDRRDPVLALNTGTLMVFVVASPERIEEFVRNQRRQEVPLGEPPDSAYDRWLVSIAQDDTLCRHAIGIVPRDDIGRA